MTGDPPEPGEDDTLPWRRRARRRVPEFRSPVVRRLAAAHDVDLSSVSGTGSAGRVTRADVLTAVASRSAITVGPMRTSIAAHMVHAQGAAAHAHVMMECDFTKVEHVRRAAGLTALPFVARAVIDALDAFPLCNATIGDDHLVVFDAVHLGIAVDLDFEGLVVPVVRDAERLRLRALADDIADLATRARARRLAPDDLVGGTITITNPGGFGTFASVPILNHPQVAILATDSVHKRVGIDPAQPALLAVRWIGMLSLAFDHRAMDGAYACAFLERVREILEARDWHAEL